MNSATDVTLGKPSTFGELACPHSGEARALVPAMVARTQALLVLTLGIVGCRGDGFGPDAHGTSGATQTGDASQGPGSATESSAESGDETQTGGDSGPQCGSESGPASTPPGGDDCPGLDCLPCGRGLGCAQSGEPILDTCCAEGDNLVHWGWGGGSEVVDVEADGPLVYLCGGFGVTIVDVSDPELPTTVVPNASPRCQHIAIGPQLPNGDRSFYLAHHGDTWVSTPFLSTYHLAAGEPTVEVDSISDLDILFEGITYHEGTLYAATHAGGVRVYSTNGQGVPTLANVIGGFQNATKLVADAETLYVADGAGGVVVLSLADPLAPEPVTTLATVGLARDVDVEDERLYVGLGGDGVGVYDISTPDDPAEVGTIDVAGSVQGVSAEGDVVAVAAWSHLAVYDAATFQLLGTERVRPSPQFEQDLGVVAVGDMIHVGEWEGLHVVEYQQGLVAPDIAIENELLNFDAAEPGDQVVVVRNRGHIELSVDCIDPGNEPAFSVDATSLQVPAGESRAFEVHYEPVDTGAFGMLGLVSNDPDMAQNPLQLPLMASDNDQYIDVGDPLTDDFGFLDPSGLGQVEGLEGHVTVLAYFALF